MADYWTENADLFRKLYQDERKTLDQVKAIAEGELHPPENCTISTYETRLRDVLKLRKKLKKQDWYLIHHYALARELGRGEYDVLLNGTQIRPDRVWKEIRRSGYHKGTECLQGIRLPKDVEVRPRQRVITSSSSGPSHTMNDTQIGTNVAQSRVTTTSTGDALQTWAAFSAALAQIDTWTLSDQVDEDHAKGRHKDLDHCKAIELLHDDLPWNRLRVAVLEVISGRQVAFRWPDLAGHFAIYMPNDGFMRMSPGWLVAGFVTTMYPTMPSLHVRSIPSDLVGMDQLVWYHHFAKVVFRLTDVRLFYLHLFDFIEFGTALGVVPPDIMLRIIQSRHESIRAIWDRFSAKLLEAAQWPRASLSIGRKEFDIDIVVRACEGFIDIILHTHPEWLETHIDTDRMLMSCGWLRCKRLMLKLLRKGAQIYYGFGQIRCSTLTYPAEAGDGEVFVALTKIFDMNAVMPSDRLFPGVDMSHFARFLMYMFDTIPILRSSVKVEHVYASLELILACGCGADVDGPYPSLFPEIDQTWEEKLSQLQSFSGQHELTCIDAAYYFDHRIFQSMLLHTRQNPQAMTRPGVCEAAAAGVQTLYSYLNSFTAVNVAQKSDFLRLILAEVFLLIPDTSNMSCEAGHPPLNPNRAKVARGLLQYGVRVNSVSSSPVSQTILLERCLASIAEHGLTDDLHAILIYFREGKTTVRPQTLEQCIEVQATDLLDLIVDHHIISAHDIRVHGSQALRKATRNRNYEAVSWLLSMGVSVHVGDSSELTIIGYSIPRTYDHYDHDDNLFLIWRCLIQHGAEFKLRPRDASCAGLLLQICDCFMNNNALLALWHFFNEFPEHLAEVSPQEWRRILESVLEGDTRGSRIGSASWFVEELLHRTADVDGMPSLVLAIQAQKHEVVQSLLSSHADIEERSSYNKSPLGTAIRVRSFALARRIISMGADINAEIGRGFGTTCDVPQLSALGEACDQEFWTDKEQCEGLNLIRDMVRQGATLNAEHVSAAERQWFRFPLHICARCGTLETATLLLQQHADPNLVMIESREFRGAEPRDYYWKHDPCTALDVAVSSCRLDMSLLLLRVGGLSSNPDGNGYEGALRSAKSRRFHAFTDMIQQHIRDLEREFETDPGRRSHHLRNIEQVREEGKDMVRRAAAGEARLNEQSRHGRIGY